MRKADDFFIFLGGFLALANEWQKEEGRADIDRYLRHGREGIGECLGQG